MAFKRKYSEKARREIQPERLEIKVRFPDAMRALLVEKARYKVGWGGRDTGKSYNSKLWYLIRMLNEPINVLCTRQVQDTISQSVHKLIVDLINKYNLGRFYRITDNKITCMQTGGEFTFKGLAAAAKDRSSLKMLNHIDIVDIEEGESLLEDTWNTFFPSIRKEGSEICIWFNTDQKATLGSFVYRRFVKDPPTKEKCLVKRLYYWDNPYLSRTSIDAINELKDNPSTYDLYKQIYLGDPSNANEIIYSSFNEKVHVRSYTVPELGEIMRTGNFFCAIDPHMVYYPFIIWGVKYPSGPNAYSYIIYNEFPYRTYSIAHGRMYHEYRETLKFPMQLSELTSCIQILDNTICNYQFKINSMTRFVDPFFVGGSGGRNWSSNTMGLIEEWVLPQNGGLKWKSPDRKEVMDGREDINRCLYWNPSIPLTALNDSILHIMPHCINVIDAMKWHRYDFDRCREEPDRKCISDTMRILMSGMTRAHYQIPSWVQRTEVKPMTMKERLKPLFSYGKKVA